jgi:hypothetical protein
MRINCEDLFLHSYLQAHTFCIGHSKYSRRGNKKSRVISDRKGSERIEATQARAKEENGKQKPGKNERENKRSFI